MLSREKTMWPKGHAKTYRVLINTPFLVDWKNLKLRFERKTSRSLYVYHTSLYLYYILILQLIHYV